MVFLMPKRPSWTLSTGQKPRKHFTGPGVLSREIKTHTKTSENLEVGVLLREKSTMVK
jgi:hypothetical protein